MSPSRSVGYLARLGALSLLLGAFTAPLRAHDWYPTACCSDRDCYEIATEALEPTPGGWRILATGEVIPYVGDRRLKTTAAIAGATYHRCSRGGGDPAMPTICLFTPPMGF